MGSTIRRFVLFVIVLVFLVLTIYLMVGGDSSTIDRYDSLVAKNDDSKIEFDKRKKYFVVNEDGSVTLTYGYNTAEEQTETEEKVEEATKPQTDEINPHWANDEYKCLILNESKHMYQFRQANFDKRISSGASVAGEGCGWCALTSAYDILMEKDDITPDNFDEIMTKTSEWSGDGMSWSAPSTLADLVDGMSLGSHRAEGIVNDPVCIDILRELAQLQRDGKKAVCVLSTSSYGVFCESGGHIILCYKADDEGFYIIDSAGSQKNTIGVEYEDTALHCHPWGTDEKDIPYNIKCAWILMRE